MNTTIASYYISEIDNWKDNIDHHLEKIDEAKEWLKELLHFNTVPKLAAKVEHHLNQLMIYRQKMESLSEVIMKLEEQLSSNKIPLADDLLTTTIKTRQDKLRSELYNIEKEFLEVKYVSDNFLAESMNIQNRMKNGDNS